MSDLALTQRRSTNDRVEQRRKREAESTSVPIGELEPLIQLRRSADSSFTQIVSMSVSAGRLSLTLRSRCVYAPLPLCQPLVYIPAPPKRFRSSFADDDPAAKWTRPSKCPLSLWWHFTNRYRIRDTTLAS